MALAPALPDNPDAVRALIRHVVRLPADAPAWDFDPVGPAQLWTRPRDESNLALLELSGRAAEALKGLSRVATDSELGRALRIIVLDLSLIFHPSSEGCFNHWAQVFATLLENFPQQLYAILTTKNGLLHSMLNYVHEGAVYEQLRNIVASAGKQDEKRAEETLRRLADRRFLHMLAERAVASGDPRAQSAADLIVAIIPELLQQAEGERLLKSIDQDFLTEITRPLKNDAATREDLEPALSVIRTLLYYSGRKLEEPATSPTMPRRAIANLLEPFRPALRTALLPLLPGIARRLTHPQQQPKPAAPKAAPAPAAAKDAPPPTAPSAAQAKDALPSADAPAATDGAAAKGAEAKEKKPPATLVAFSAYKVREPFSSYRFALLGIIVELARKYTPEENFFDKLDVEFWRAVVAWFFDYPHNNMLHCMFFRLFSELVRANHEPSLRALLSKGKFLSRMISAYSDKSIDSRAFILAMANMLRLTAASLPRTAFLADFLGAHAQWKSFLPVLLAESMAEQPRTAVAGTHPITPQLTPAWRRVTSYDPADGLELGSSFSKALGFGTNVQDEVIEIGGRAISGEADDTAPRRPMLKAAAKGFARAAAPAIESTPAPRPAPPTASATSPPAPAAAGGKKKKKKKKSAAAAAGANDDDDLEP